MTGEEINFLGAVLGSAIGLIGAFLGIYFGTKNEFSSIIKNANMTAEEKASKCNRLLKVIFYIGVMLVISMSGVFLLVKFVPSTANTTLYISLLISLQLALLASIFYICHRYNKHA